MSVGALLGFDESQLPANEREVLRVLVVELGATLTEGERSVIGETRAVPLGQQRDSVDGTSVVSPSVGVDQLTIEEAA